MTVPTIQQLRTRLREILGPRLGEAFGAVADDANLAETLGEGYDSLTAMECVTTVEQEFGLVVDFVADDVRYWFSSVDRMSQFVRDRLEDAVVLRGAG